MQNVACLFWPGKSPDLDMIEPCWPHMKCITTYKGAATAAKKAEKEWIKCWKDLEQDRIQRWIERIVQHVKKVNYLLGDNCYREGSMEELIESRKASTLVRIRTLLAKRKGVPKTTNLTTEGINKHARNL